MPWAMATPWSTASAWARQLTVFSPWPKASTAGGAMKQRDANAASTIATLKRSPVVSAVNMGWAIGPSLSLDSKPRAAGRGPQASPAITKSLVSGALLVGAALIDVVEPDDIVLVEIGPRLDLDEEGRDLAGIGEAVLLADGDIGGFVLAQHRHLLAACHLHRPGDHDPMLRTVMVALQRQLAAGLHHDAFDLIALAPVQALIPAPRTIDAIVLEREVAAGPFQIFDHKLDVLGVVLRGNEHGVLHGHHHQVLHPHQGDASVIAEDEAVGRVFEDNLAVALHHVAGGVLGQEAPQGLP